MKANQCAHFDLGHCKSADAPTRACVLMDRRVKACTWFVFVRKGPEPMPLAAYQAWAEHRVSERRKTGRRAEEKAEPLNVPIFKDLK